MNVNRPIIVVTFEIFRASHVIKICKIALLKCLISATIETFIILVIHNHANDEEQIPKVLSSDILNF